MTNLEHQLIPWPDRTGFWIVKHRWGMELVESFEHGDDEEGQPFAIKVHHGGDRSEGESFMPHDFAEEPPQFHWLGEAFPFQTP